ncbi:MAG: nucleoside triphosphate pyrophosphohydrolase [Bdellovibrionaceae bacterium]|nr:nucleoside triphosphate pyrophosphohydrolase [Pseudobdellovibrionaceae bacterium]|tara:strand:+ start:61816 stop:62601 length:786 start_codon:yes stop_codon:yes gene_type:complete
MVQPPKDLTQFSSFVQIVQALRGPEGCPWDKEQTHKSLAKYAIEEAHEYAEAVDLDDVELMKEELGDILLQVVLNSIVGEQESKFELSQVIESISEKMVRRHPHVFSSDTADSTQTVKDNWEAIKAKEKPKKPGFNLPPSLPALAGSLKIGEKTKKVGFDWSHTDDVFGKLDEEIAELQEAITSEKTEDIEAELGDCLFTLAQIGRHLGIDPEQALRKTNQRFEKRYVYMTDQLSGTDKTLGDLSMSEKELLWNKAKLNTK